MEVKKMPTQEWFEVQVMVAAEEARQAGFEQTYLALVDVLRASRLSHERMISALSTSQPHLSLSGQTTNQDGGTRLGFTNH